MALLPQVSNIKMGEIHTMKSQRITAALLIPCMLLSACKESTSQLLPHTDKAQVLALDSDWGRVEWRRFVSSLSDSNLVELALVYEALRPGTPGISNKGEILDAKMALNFNSGREAVVDSMQVNAMNAYWNRIEKATTMFTNPGYHVEWHEVVKRACFFANVEGVAYGNKHSFDAEQALIKKLVSDSWDRMSREQRAEVIKNSEALSNLTDSQKSAILVGGGGVFIATLSSSILLSGFVFYTTMSSVICASAGALGLTLPFGAYVGVSSTAALLSGPVGWTVAGIAIIGSFVVMFNDPDKEKVVKIVIATHLMKAKVLYSK